MSIQTDQHAMDVAFAFTARAASFISIGGARWSAIDSHHRENFPGMFTTHLASQRMIVSVSGCLMPLWNGGIIKGHFTQELRTWKDKMHEAIRRTDQRKPHPERRTEQIHATFDRLNPKGHVTAEVRCDLILPKSPFNVSGAREIRCVITATAPLARRGKPVEIRRQQLLVLESIATKDFMDRVAPHYASFFGPDYEDDP